MKKSSATLIALAAGLAVGGVLGILFAPDKGSETRKKISDSGTKLSDRLKDQVQKSKESLLSLREDLKEKIDASKEKMEEYI